MLIAQAFLENTAAVAFKTPAGFAGTVLVVVEYSAGCMTFKRSLKNDAELLHGHLMMRCRFNHVHKVFGLRDVGVHVFRASSVK